MSPSLVVIATAGVSRSNTTTNQGEEKSFFLLVRTVSLTKGCRDCQGSSRKAVVDACGRSSPSMLIRTCLHSLLLLLLQQHNRIGCTLLNKLPLIKLAYFISSPTKLITTKDHTEAPILCKLLALFLLLSRRLF